jgi:hypothetical protein
MREGEGEPVPLAGGLVDRSPVPASVRDRAAAGAPQPDRRFTVRGAGKAATIALLAAAAIAAFHSDEAAGAVTKPQALVLRAYEPRVWVGDVPAGAVESSVTVSHRTWTDDTLYEEAAGPACRWKSVIGHGHTGVLVVHHDDCRAHHPRATITWVPRPGPRPRVLRVSVQAQYLIAREVPSDVGEPEVPSDLVLLCSVVPADQVPPDAIELSGRDRFRRAQAYLAGPVTP